MLPKHYRLKKRSAFKATYKVKNSSHSGGVTLFAGILKKEDYPTKAIKSEPQMMKTSASTIASLEVDLAKARESYKATKVKIR